jgi:hypothetical protein
MEVSTDIRKYSFSTEPGRPERNQKVGRTFDHQQRPDVTFYKTEKGLHQGRWVKDNFV